MSNAGRKEKEIFRTVFKSILTCPATHVVAGMVILLVDVMTGPNLRFPVLFVIPVVLSAWLCSARLAWGLAVFLPVGRCLIASYVESSVIMAAPSVWYDVINALIRIAVLGFVAALVARTARQSREIKILQGLLPLCMFCKRIRGEGQQWEELEAYISAHSEAEFSHGLCVECAQKHYGDVLDPQLLKDRKRTSPAETCACGTEKELATGSHR